MTDSSLPTELFGYDYYQNPYPAFQWLRENSPVHEFRFPVGDVRTWIVSRFDDVHALLGDPRFSNDAEAYASQEFLDSGMVLGADTVVSRILTVLDPPDHTRVRKLAMGAFTPRRVAQWKEPTARIVASALDRLEKSENPDAVEYASAIPAEVIGEILGIPLDRYNDMLDAIDRAFRPGDDKDAISRAFEEIAEYGRDLIREKRKSPGDDLMTVFIQARDGDDRLNEDELVAMLALMIMAGLDTTRNLIGSAILHLLDHSGQRRRLAEQPELMPSAVEEFLRYDGALTVGLFRFAKEDMEFAGTPLPAGAPIVAALQSANRDPERFTDPDRLDITRNGPRHLGLGHGLHNCLGAALARVEAGIAIPAVFERFPNLALAVPRNEITYSENWLLRGLTALPVHLYGADTR
ncbi:cytochrome P450 [Streptomyces sp. A3M-1-3]|uniref:cytochrome P450 family protein n=1 Tax=Streptomyces sp. A3M-1-3 TaxID=2962044 RepID=UPI0020B7B744|nr:cytochrome P450 [Streptomyces sp. A3M-1-3]MCP3822756.1 cytochrome P450 [Streptomyces sp. A3M-1-3]